MPIYERRCDSCAVVYSILCKVADRDLPDTCPNCECPDTTPILSPTRTDFVFADKSANKRGRQ